MSGPQGPDANPWQVSGADQPATGADHYTETPAWAPPGTEMPAWQPPAYPPQYPPYGQPQGVPGYPPPAYGAPEYNPAAYGQPGQYPQPGVYGAPPQYGQYPVPGQYPARLRRALDHRPDLGRTRSSQSELVRGLQTTTLRLPTPLFRHRLRPGPPADSPIPGSLRRSVLAHMP